MLTLALRANGLQAAHVDSRQVIVTNDRFSEAAPLFELTKARLNATIPPLVEEGNVVVMGGFIASNEKGVTTTLGRGGSDFTASLVGAALGVEEVQIWTDVDGVHDRRPDACCATRTACGSCRSAKPPSWPISAPRCCTPAPCCRR